MTRFSLSLPLALALVLTGALLLGCEVTTGGASDTGTRDTADTPTCPSVDENLNYPSGDPGTWTRSESICSGDTHKYSLNVGCGAPRPACGSCSVSATLTYSEAAADLVLEIYQENGNEFQSASSETASPKTASAVVPFGGSFSARVRHASGPTASYSVEVRYGCP